MDWVSTLMDEPQEKLHMWLSIRGLGSVVAFSGSLENYLCVCLHMIANPAVGTVQLTIITESPFL